MSSTVLVWPNHGKELCLTKLCIFDTGMQIWVAFHRVSLVSIQCLPRTSISSSCIHQQHRPEPHTWERASRTDCRESSDGEVVLIRLVWNSSIYSHTNYFHIFILMEIFDPFLRRSLRALSFAPKWLAGFLVAYTNMEDSAIFTTHGRIFCILL